MTVLNDALCLLLFYLKGEGKSMTGLDRDMKDAIVFTGQQIAMSAESVAVALMQIAEAWGASMEELQNALMSVTGNVGISTSMTAEELAIALECMEPHEQSMKQVHKLCLKRPRIIHQVSNRQPRNRVNKIIR